MTVTPNLSLPYILADQAQKHISHNESISALDVLVQMSVLDRTLTAPPPAPNDGDRYIVAANATGTWAGNDQAIAAWQDGAWAFYGPKPGWCAWVVPESVIVIWNGTAWVSNGIADVNPTPLVGVNAVADTTNRLSVNAPASLFNHEGDSHRLKVNKNATGDTASVMFQTGFSGRAEFGLTGDDDFHIKVSRDGNTFIDALVIDQATGAAKLPATTGVSNENLLINGDFQINQRGFANGAMAANTYGFDRWKAGTVGADVSLSGYTMTLNSGTLVQVVEPVMAGVTSFANIAVTISLEDPSADVTVIVGSTSGTIRAGTGRQSVMLVPAAGDVGDLPLKMTAAAPGSVTFARVKLELGSVATAWRARLFPAEYALCQRYFQASAPFGQNPATYAPGAGYGSIYAFAHPSSGSVAAVRLPTLMRVKPTITIRDGAANANRVAAYNNQAWLNDFSFTGVLGLSDKGFSLQQNNAGVLGIAFDYAAEAEL